jgi:hypothetical protein
MSNQGKAEAIEILRKEVGYGCPICRSPFLTWHHFDPPWAVEQHWRAPGMIALCLEHHTAADAKGEYAGNYSRDELRAMKQANYQDKHVSGSYISWQKKSVLVRLGGCYTDASRPIISVGGEAQLLLRKNEAGILSLSFVLRNAQDQQVVCMIDNWFVAYPRNIHDMVVLPTTKATKVWLTKEDIGLELSFRRLTLEQLGEQVAADWLWEQHLLSEQGVSSELPRLPPHAADWTDEDRQAYRVRGFIGTAVVRWARENCLMDDNLVPFLNFEQLAINYHGQRYTIREGVQGSFAFRLRNSFIHDIHVGSIISLPCYCHACLASGRRDAGGGFGIR